MNNVNEILKRQLLLMKFDSGVTLKENYEKVSGKRILKEFFEEADRVKNIVNGCYTRDNNKGLLLNNAKMYEIYADKFKAAIGYGGGTDCDIIRELNEFISTNMSYSDLCMTIFTYDGRHHKDGAGDGFYEDLDYDIQVDYGECGWTKIANAFQNAVDKQALADKATSPAPAPVVTTPAPVETTPVEAPNTDSDNKYMKPGPRERSFDWFRRNFPCVFAKRRVKIDEVYNNGEHDFILIFAPGGETVQLFWDGFLRKLENNNIVDVKWEGNPAKLFCDTSDDTKILITAR